MFAHKRIRKKSNVRLYANGGDAVVKSVKAWKMETIYKPPTTAKERSQERDGTRERLCEPAMNAFAGIDLGGVMARERPDGAVSQQERRHRISHSRLKS